MVILIYSSSSSARDAFEGGAAEEAVFDMMGSGWCNAVVFWCVLIK